MKVGIGLPITLQGVSGEHVLEWARRAEAGPFSTLGTLDRVVRVRQSYVIAEDSWKAAGRAGRPRFVSCAYYALGEDVREEATANQRHYYAFMGERAEQMAHNFLSTPDGIRQVIEGFGDLGTDELIFWPTDASFEQIDRLAQVI